MNPLDTVLSYHETTKHHPHRYARSLGYLDWANQPDPFRRFEGAPTVPLLLSKHGATPSYDDLYQPGTMHPAPVSLASISEFFQYSMALSAWKEYRGSRWALRINPSSGNLHPTEAYIAIGAADGLTETPGVFHYAPKDHVLERRCTIQPGDWVRLLARFPPGTFFAGLSSIHWREAWKYGERAYRYCQHDVGHALAAVALSAAVQGWRVHPLSALTHGDVEGLLGLDRAADFDGAEREHPDLLLAVISAGVITSDLPADLSRDAIQAVRRHEWLGKANRLSGDHVDWEIIDSVADACVKESSAIHSGPVIAEAPGPLNPSRPAGSARQIIFQRRSALAMDGRTRITADQFYLMLDRVLPRFDRPPWRALGPPAYVHLALFVHLIEGLSPGLYFLVRTASQLDRLREATRPEFDWTRPKACPESLPLHHLLSGDTSALAGNISCGQDIAADGAFSLGMIAEFAEPLRSVGPWLYRRLFWETGMIGQVLYLEAEAAGIGSTGIGCFFDDMVHEVLGLSGSKYQSLYHFTVGGPVEDARLTGLPPYPPGVSQVRQPPQSDR